MELLENQFKMQRLNAFGINKRCLMLVGHAQSKLYFLMRMENI